MMVSVTGCTCSCSTPMAAQEGEFSSGQETRPDDCFFTPLCGILSIAEHSFHWPNGHGDSRRFLISPPPQRMSSAWAKIIELALPRNALGHSVGHDRSAGDGLHDPGKEA